MSRQQRKDIGTQDFRKFPYVDVEPLPDVSVPSYVRYALKNNYFGSKLPYPWSSRPFVCRKTGKSYIFWDNYLNHVKNLSPLYGPTTDRVLSNYQSHYDDRTFHFRDNFKLHNRVKRFEEAQEIETLKRLHGYSGKGDLTEKDIQMQVKKKKLSFRFLKTDERTLEEEIAELKRKRRSQQMAEQNFHDDPQEMEQEEAGEVAGEVAMDLEEPFKVLGKPSMKWPRNYDDLPPIKRPKRPERPEYLGWTHSYKADSWFLEAHTPYVHEDFNQFVGELHEKKVICPRLWTTVFPVSERAIMPRDSMMDEFQRALSSDRL